MSACANSTKRGSPAPSARWRPAPTSPVSRSRWRAAPATDRGHRPCGGDLGRAERAGCRSSKPPSRPPRRPIRHGPACLPSNRVAAAEFITALRPLTILGRMSGYRRVPMQTKVQRMTAGATVGWVGEVKPTPVTSVTLDTIELDNFKIAGIVCATDDLIKLSSPAADGLVRADLLAAVAEMQDRALLDPAAAAVAGVSPASITNGALQIAATGTALSNLTADLAALFAELTSNGIPLTAPYLLMAPQTAVRLSLMNTAGAGFSTSTRAARRSRPFRSSPAAACRRRTSCCSTRPS